MLYMLKVNIDQDQEKLYKLLCSSYNHSNKSSDESSTLTTVIINKNNENNKNKSGLVFKFQY